MTLGIRDFQVLKNPDQHAVVAVSDGQFSFNAGFFSRAHAEERFQVGMGWEQSCTRWPATG
jgi:transcriptional regulator of nitric oxide reductase